MRPPRPRCVAAAFLTVGLFLAVGGPSSASPLAEATDENSDAGPVQGGGNDGQSSNPVFTPDASQSGGNTVDVALTGELRNAQQVIAAPGVLEWLLDCTAQTFDSEEGPRVAALVSSSAAAVEDPGNGWIGLFCAGRRGLFADGDIGATEEIIGVWPIGTRPPQVVLDVLIAQARASLELPLHIGQAAPFGDTNAPLITQLPTWLWIDPAVWAPRSASTPPVFDVFVTATATPVNVTFANDAGDALNCGANTGPAYNFALDDSQQHSPCTLTYKHSTAVGAHSLTTTLTWDVTYACSAFCGTGTLPGFTITTTRNVRVAELQAIATANP